MFRLLKITFIALIFPLTLLSQVTVDNNVNLDNFPEIEISFNDRNPNIVDWSSISLYELIDSTELELDFIRVETNDNFKPDISENKCVYILLEALYNENRVEQLVTFHSAILESLEDFVNEGDLIKIATFSLKDENGKILNSLNDNFTDNTSELYSAVNSLQVENTAFTNKGVSDLYGAGLEAIQEMNELNTSFPKTLLILSEERNNKYSTQRSSDQLVNKAKDLGFVINTIKYNRSGYHQHTDPTLADYTYGEKIILPVSSGDLDGVHLEKLELAKQSIVKILNEFTSTVVGNNYLITAKLNNTVENGAASELRLHGISAEKQIISFKRPGNFIFYNFRVNTLISITVSLILLLILFLIYYVSGKKIKERKKRRIEIIESQNVFQSKISKQNDSIESLLNEQKLQKLNEDIVLAESLLLAEEKQLIKQMKNSGGFPVLSSSEFADNNFVINRPLITVGRDKSNSICISNPNISKTHFEIIFEDGSYIINDLDSLNGLLVNAIKIKNSVLNNGDSITIADVSITFYL